MFLPLLIIIAFITIAVVAGIAYLTRERAGHSVRHDVRATVVHSENVTGQSKDPQAGYKS